MCLAGSLYVRSLIEGVGTLPRVPTLCRRLGVCVLHPLFRPLPSLSPSNVRDKTTASRSQDLSLSLAGITFTRDGRYLALAERRDCRDYVSIFVCSDWQLLRVRRTPGSMTLGWGGGRGTFSKVPEALPGGVRKTAPCFQRWVLPVTPWHAHGQVFTGSGETAWALRVLAVNSPPDGSRQASCWLSGVSVRVPTSGGGVSCRLLTACLDGQEAARPDPRGWAGSRMLSDGGLLDQGSDVLGGSPLS